jgi:hypothetical protein
LEQLELRLLTINSTLADVGCGHLNDPVSTRQSFDAI